MTPGSPLKCPTSTATSSAAANLETREVRLALLEERAERFFRLGRGQPLAEDARLFLDGGAECLAVARFHQPFGEADGFGRQGCERHGRFFCFSQKTFLRDHGGHHACFEAFCAVNGWPRSSSSAARW